MAKQILANAFYMASPAQSWTGLWAHPDSTGARYNELEYWTDLARTAERPRRRWIWVHHAPPDGSPLAWDGRRAWGDDTLSGWIKRYEPDLVLTGHVHQAPFVPGGGWVDRIGPTWVLNAGQQPGPVPARIEVDLDVGAAVWTSADDRAEIAF